MKNKSSTFLLILSIIILFFAIVGIIVTPFVINGITKCEPLKKADILAYCGTAISVVSSVFLSCIAVNISIKANEVSDRMLKIEEEKMIPYLDILRERSSVIACDDANDKLKVKLYVRNLGKYPIQNILLSRIELSKNEVEALYIKDEIQNVIFNQLEMIDNNSKNSINYNLTCIAGLREMIITHSKSKNGGTVEEEEHTPFSEWLYFNIDKKEVGAPIDVFINMQNIAGKVFVQKTTLFIKQLQTNKKIFLTMHSKQIETIKL